MAIYSSRQKLIRSPTLLLNHTDDCTGTTPPACSMRCKKSKLTNPTKMMLSSPFIFPCLLRYLFIVTITTIFILHPHIASHVLVQAQSFWSQQQQQQPSPLSNFAPYMSTGGGGGGESYNAASLFSPYNFYNDPSGAAAMMAPRSGGGGGGAAAMSQPFMYGGGGSGGSLGAGGQQASAAFNPYMQVQSNSFFPMMDALKMPGTTCYCELRENKLGVPGDLFDTLVYPALQNTECLVAGPECNTACEAQARKQYDIPAVITEEGVLNKQNKDGVSIGSRICAAYNKPIPGPGVKIAVFAKAETCPKAQVVVELLGAEELKFCCLYGDHPFILTEKILLYSPECMGLATASGVPPEPAPAASAAAGTATAAGGTPGTPVAAAQPTNPFLTRYNENNNPFSPASLFNPFAGLPGMGPQGVPAPQSATNPISSMMAAMFGGGGGQPGKYGSNGVLGTAGVMTGAGGLGMHQQNPMAMPFYPMSSPMTMPPQQQQQQQQHQSSHHQSNNGPGSVQMMPYKAAPANAPG